MAHLDKRALFDFVGYEPHAGQILVHRSKAKFRVLACGVRWGKSTCASMEALAAMLEPRDESIGWIVGGTYDISKRVFQRVVDTMHRCFEHHLESFDASQHRLVVRNLAGGRSELRGKTADNPDSLLGEGLDYLVVDEAARVESSVWDEHLSQRLIDKDGWAVFLSTPGKREGWFHRMHKLGAKRRDPAVESWSSPSWTNPVLRQSVIEAERRRLDEEVFRNQYGAEFIGNDNDSCEVCGGPAVGLPTVILAPAEGDFAKCPNCGEMVDAAGRTLVARYPDGRRAVMTIIHLGPRTDGSPTPPPMRCVPDPGSEPRMITGDDLP